MESKDHKPTHLALPTCDGCAAPFTGQRPYRFSDRALGTWTEAQAAEAWRARFQEPLPPSRRRTAAPPERAGVPVRVLVLRTQEETERMDALRGVSE